VESEGRGRWDGVWEWLGVLWASSCGVSKGKGYIRGCGSEWIACEFMSLMVMQGVGDV